MIKRIFMLGAAMAIAISGSVGRPKLESDVFNTSAGKLKIYFVGHASLIFEINKKRIYVDPWNKLADYTKLPKGDIILITHHHQDHLDTNAINAVSTAGTQIVLTAAAYDILGKGTVLHNGEKVLLEGFEIEAVPAYNSTEGRDKFHPRGRDNGYILTIGKKRIYIAGDTEDIPEMGSFKNIDIAFLPMNQPYTMLPEQVAEAVKRLHPKILYPYHYGETDPSRLTKLLSEEKGVEVRIRSLR